MYLGNVDGAQCHAILDSRFWILDCGLKQQPVGIRIGIKIRIKIRIGIKIRIRIKIGIKIRIGIKIKIKIRIMGGGNRGAESHPRSGTCET